MFRLVLALVLGITTTAIAQENTKYFYTRQECQPVAIMVNNLKNKWGEIPLFTGVGLTFDIEGNPFTGGSMFFVNQDTGSWTLITLYNDGTSCITAVGTEFSPY